MPKRGLSSGYFYPKPENAKARQFYRDLLSIQKADFGQLFCLPSLDPSWFLVFRDS